MPYIYDILTDSIHRTYVAGAPTLSHQLRIIPCLLFTFVECFEILTRHVFLHLCSDCLRQFIFQVKKKEKKSSLASVFDSYNFTILRVYSIRETFVFHTEIYTFRIFIGSLCCFYFSSCLCRQDQCVVFFPKRSTRACRCHGR